MSRLEERIRIGIIGLGWVGQEVARAALEDARVSLVGVTDIDPVKAGRDLGEIIGEGRLGVPIDTDVEAMLARARPEVAVVTTTSDVEALGPTLEQCIAQGAHVVTTCENLADGELALAQLETGFDERARDAGVVVLATGVNPGFAMDRLPVMLAQATRNIRRIRVSRVVDASTRRAQLQAKIGVGRQPSEFAEAIRDGTIGHAGLSASLRLVSKGLGIVLEKTSEAFSPVIAASDTTSTLGPVAAGRVRGIYQIARGYRNGREVVTLELTMALGEPTPRDTIDIVGEPPIHFEGELPGDECTVATVLSAISVVVNMQPGLRSVLDVPLEQPEEPPAPSRSYSAAVTELPGRRPEPDERLDDGVATDHGQAAARSADGDASTIDPTSERKRKSPATAAAAKKSARQKGATNKASARQSLRKKASAKKASAKKASAKKASAKRRSGKKGSGKRGPAEKVAASEASAAAPNRPSSAKRSPSRARAAQERRQSERDRSGAEGIAPEPAADG